jgi:hypothetical protein
MNTSAIVALSALLLAACGTESTTQSAARTGDVSLTNASVAEVAKQAAAAKAGGAASFEPGEWETVVTIEGANIPGMPAVAAKAMEGLKRARTSVRSCMTPEQAAKPDEAMFAGKGVNCRFDRYVMMDGRLDATMSCAGEGGGERAVIAMKGGFTRTSFNLINSMTAAPMPGHPKVAMQSRVTGKRLGACRGKGEER